MEKNIMASPAVAPTVAPVIDLSKTESCVSITINFRMGIGRMRQIKNLKVETDTKASELRHQKRLIDSPELEEIRSQDGFLKRYVESKSCWYREATRFLPRVWLTEVDRAIVAYQTIRRPKLVAAFMHQYRLLEAVNFAPLQEALGENFDRSDYPASDIVERGFVLDFNYRNVGSANLTGMSDVIIAREQEKERSIRMEAILEWRDAMRLAGAEMVDALFDMLKPEAGKTKKMYGCHVEHLQEFIDTFPDRDLVGDTEFKKNLDVIKDAMKGVTIDRLKESKNLQTYIMSKLDSVRADMKKLVITSGRKFR
jgi:hypothetical protein